MQVLEFVSFIESIKEWSEMDIQSLKGRNRGKENRFIKIPS